MFAWIEQFLAIARTTLVECLRQPVSLATVIVATILVTLSNPLSAYTLSNDNHMFVDIGLSTIFLAGAILAAFLATSAISREIENRTLLTVISKPVPRAIFVVGRFAGIAGALVVTMLFLALVFAIVEQHGVLETAATPIHLSVILFGTLGMLVAVAGATWLNYMHDRSFGASFLLLGVPCLGVAYVVSMLFDAKMVSQSMSVAFEPEQWKAMILIVEGILVLCAIAVAASTRLGQVPTLVLTLAALVCGLLSDWVFGRTVLAYQAAHGGGAVQAQVTEVAVTLSQDASVPLVSASSEAVSETAYAIACVGWAVVPNFQMFFVTDAINQGIGVPAAYFGLATGYAALLVTAFLALSVMFFQRRELG
ncbi:MAG: hypothetical protein O2819_01285 [Planctomycetota bacterium]|nr:hypothetical protein [Planctomycetota bacterium]MDA1104983.1 hypothetical protein [Planctomycetota bacterium]